MKKTALGLSIALALGLLTVAWASGERPGARTVAASPADALNYLPASDAVMLIDVRRLLNETMPQILAGDKEKLAQANSEIDKFKTRTGIDPRSFDRVVLGVRYTYPTANTTKLETVAVAHGKFDAKALAAACRLCARQSKRAREAARTVN